MNRREFIKKSLFAGLAITAPLLAGKQTKLFAENSNLPDLVAVKGDTPESMFDLGIKALGGIKNFIKKGQTVVIKPNIGWNRTPEYASTTNPKLIGQIIKHCIDAGAKKVYVFDNTCDEWEQCYKNSGIQKEAINNGALTVPANDTGYYHEIKIPDGIILKKTMVHELLLEPNTYFINVPILKSHGSTKLTIAMKNLMGVIEDRGFYHQKGLHQCIADFCTWKKPDLNIVDAYLVLKQNGPRGVSKEDTISMRSLLISTDIVAIDSAAAKLYGIEPERIPYIKIANDMNLGIMDLSKLNIKKISA